RRKRQAPTPRGHLARASMRPPLFSGGNFVGTIHGVDEDLASMRPPLFSGGNLRAHLGDGGLRLASMRPPLFSGGNDAVGLASANLDTASMRPPLFSGGNACAPRVAVADHGRFNEASALQRRKRAL